MSQSLLDQVILENDKMPTIQDGQLAENQTVMAYAPTEAAILEYVPTMGGMGTYSVVQLRLKGNGTGWFYVATDYTK
jgi:hypothetical protein